MENNGESGKTRDQEEQKLSPLLAYALFCVDQLATRSASEPTLSDWIH